jgi:hypothetical protein
MYNGRKTREDNMAMFQAKSALRLAATLSASDRWHRENIIRSNEERLITQS